MNRKVLLVVCAAALWLVPAAAEQGRAAKPQPPAKPTVKPAPVERSGATIYREYCAVCHGQGGRGNGPAASALRVRPADLTRIATRHKGFPRREIESMILGDDPLHPAHGNREMPIWGPTFRESPDARTLLHKLMTHLESIQEK